ncbi:GvpL/GvpF family gas vesicle protein [Streptomyces millisiae]|uniref:GvpL/GvpF family gas vesicle protein n=1 Tax=Streptomyces millisiae TaxID=3075542 RepID=A0ABU2LLA7_9ACTN|nr:GvpL/GvpF family gas vesicle protein [Streptomyces sp. DSM 44918]MDT0317833.1 GvpL/GvpF family gas vesicle protein [Streptomyces sp. DSM 44918]
MRDDTHDDTERDQLWYVYAVTRARGADSVREELRGLDGAPVHALRDGALAAVASPVRAADFAEEPLRAHLEDLGWLERTARGHQRVVDGLLSTGCVLPMRLATVCRDPAGVRRLLTGNRAGLEAAIERLDGCAEWGVKMYAEPSCATPSDSAATNPPASGRDYLRRRWEDARAAEEAARNAAEAAREVHETLTAAAERARLHPPQDPRLSGEPGQNVLNSAYLVPREREREFSALAGRLAGRLTAHRLTLSGPWAPYSFGAAAAGATADAEGSTSGD